jgi:hypothetical protein
MSFHPAYSKFFEEIIDFARRLIAYDPERGERKRVQYWTALALLARRHVQSGGRRGNAQYPHVESGCRHR